MTFLHYCDKCAGNKGLPIDSEKIVKGTCNICNQFSGPLNEVQQESVVPNDIMKDIIEIGSFEIEQLDNFLPGMNPKDIHPTLPYKIHSQDLVMYFPALKDDPEGRKTIIVANPQLGEQFIIRIKKRDQK